MKKGFEKIVEAVDKALASSDEGVMLLLENTAGTRNSMGSFFEDIEHILSRIKDIDRVGVCFDTCHAFAAGYDLVGLCFAYGFQVMLCNLYGLVYLTGSL